ncbi:11584_t:CDS:1 [Diversispora eburnea]|uniref:11584_t:CDS:1 n=1 Tax=Diversispora eburnea TaxID=1213867 RepID=A0A9N9FGI1_9GLOM|nr:11584_t:CDS:1 [Diversispora eburnea]
MEDHENARNASNESNPKQTNNSLSMSKQQTSIEQFFDSKEKATESSKESYRFYKLEMPQAEVLYYPSILSSEECSKSYTELINLPYWIRPTFKIYGRPVLAHRLTCSFGSNPNKAYHYSGTLASADALEYPPSIKLIKEKLEFILNTDFNFVLLNWYKNGSDYIGEHSDDERGLAPNGMIASVSLGASRKFVFRNKLNKKNVQKLISQNGSLMIMKGTTQKYWKHYIPKEKKITEGRISLTFRQLI